WDTQPISGNFTIEYTTDNGSNWNTITTLPGNFRMYEWTVPNTITDQAKVRITRGGVSDESISPFNIIDVPTGLSISYVCTTTAFLTWDVMPGAAEYEVYMLGEQYMDSIGRSITNSICANINNPSGDLWFAVSAIPTAGGRAGRRTLATLYNGTIQTCASLDIGVGSLLSPSTDQLSLCFNDTINIEFTVANVGQTPQSGFTYGYQIDSDPAISQAYLGTLNDCSSDTVSIIAPLSALPPGPHSLKIWTNLPTDLNSSNDTLTIDVNIIGLPYTEDFELFDLCGTTPNCEQEICTLSGSWVNQTNGVDDDIDWLVDEGGTPSDDTGPDNDHNPGTAIGNYLYLEASNGCSFQEARLISPCMNLGGTTAPTLTFWYHMFGDDMGSLHVDLSADGSTWINDIIPAVSGNQGNNWIQGIADLSAYAGQSIQIRFRGITGNGFESDMAIDDILVLDQSASPSADFEANLLDVCPTQTVQFTDLSIPVATSWSWSFTPNTVIFLNGTSSTSQNPLVQFTSLGAYDVSLTATSVNGSTTQTKPAYIDVNNGAAVPITEDFETNSLCGTANNCELENCQITGIWNNLPNLILDDIDWRVDEGGTASNNTGPSADHTLGTPDGNYIYLEASGGCTNEEAILESGCIDLTGAANPYISFWYHMFGADMGSLHMDVFDGNAWVLDVMTPISGDQGDVWLEASTNLIAYAGQSIQIRIRAITGAGFTSDIAIDDIFIGNLTASPLTDFSANPTETCVGIPVTFTDLSTSAPSAWSWAISPNTFSYVNGTDSASQNPSVIFSTTGSYTVTLISTNVNGSDTLVKTNFINIGSGTALPFMEDFQSGQVPPANWTLDNPDGADTWENTNVIGSDGMLTNVAWIDNFSYNGPGQLDILQTFTIDLDPTVAQGALLSFDLAYARFNGNFFDRLYIELSDDCGANFNNVIFDKESTDLATVADQTTLWVPSDSSEWRRESISLAPYVGQVIQLRFITENGFGNSLYIDNINIESVAPPSAGFGLDPIVVCEGETIVVSDSSSGDDLAYNWDFGPGATPATANTAGPHNVSYTGAGSKSISLTVSNAVGSNTLSQNIMVEPLPVASFNTATDNGNAFSFTSTATGSPTSYQWSFGDDSTSTEMDPKHTYQNNGKYTVSLIVTNNCGSDTITQDLEISTVGIEDELTGVSISITPNPSNGEFGVWFKGDRQGDLTLDLLDIKGRALQAKSVFFAGGEFQQEFHASNLAKGVYILRITMEQESVYRRIVIQ
ncbi:MAG: PKD domain-containing protein, partial [Bacteroidota bacterium]